MLLCLLWGGKIFAQDSTLVEINKRRISVNKTAMMVLGGWAVGNIALGASLRSQTLGTKRYFHEMNLIWNVVNLSIASVGLYNNFSSNLTSMGLGDTFFEQNKLERILLFNLALNVSYIVGGGWMIERSKTAINNSQRLKGYGRSLILQGSFLLAFDTTQYLIHNLSSAPKLKELLSYLHPSAQGIELVFNF